MKKVLVTGMSGLIGNAVREKLASTCELSALNRRDVPGVPCHRADIADLEAIQPAFEGIDVVIHMAAAIRADWDGFLQSNIVGTYNVFEAARQAGVKRVIYASSGSVTAGYESISPYKEIASGDYENAPESWDMLSRDTPTWPKGIYGCMKVWGEAIARHFSDSSDLSIICLRIGAVNAKNEPNQTRGFSVHCSQENISGMVEACVNAPPEVKFNIFYVISNNKWSYRNTEHAREVLGYEPHGNAEDYR